MREKWDAAKKEKKENRKQWKRKMNASATDNETLTPGTHQLDEEDNKTSGETTEQWSPETGYVQTHQTARKQEDDDSENMDGQGK